MPDSIGLSLSQDATLWGKRTCACEKDGVPKLRLHLQNMGVVLEPFWATNPGARERLNYMMEAFWKTAPT